MILAAEWLKKKCIKMNQEWINTMMQPKEMTRKVIPYLTLPLSISLDEFVSRIPIGMSSSGEVIIPNVRNVSELYSETVPWPQIWQFFPGSVLPLPVLSCTGGVTTKSFVVDKVLTRQQVVQPASRREQYSQVEDTIAVSARSGPRIRKTKKAPERIIPRQSIVTIPQRDVHVETNESRVSEQLTLKDYRNYGCSDHPQQSGPHSGGKRIVKEESPHHQTPVQRGQPEISAAMGTDMPEYSHRSSLDSGFSDHSIFTNSPQHSSADEREATPSPHIHTEQEEISAQTETDNTSVNSGISSTSPMSSDTECSNDSDELSNATVME